jgi:ABC-type multidrug transport system ATPase subunit
VINVGMRRPPPPGVARDKVVETTGLTKVYGKDIIAVDRLDLSVYRGEVYGFLGPNGAGKTTTLRMLLGLIRPTIGGAKVMGAEPGSPESLVKVGAIVETPAFYPYMSGYDNLRLLAIYCGVPMSRVDATLEQVELTPRARHKFSTYSMGMKQRLGIAAALLKEPDLLILDEPTNGLDPQGREEMLALIQDISRRRQMSLILCSHLLRDVEQVCENVIVFNQGKVAARGPIAALTGPRRSVYDVRLKGDAAGFLTDLKDLGCEWRESEDGYRVFLTDGTGPELLFKTARESGVQVRYLRPGAESLEDVFLRALGHEVDA